MLGKSLGFSKTGEDWNMFKGQFFISQEVQKNNAEKKNPNHREGPFSNSVAQFQSLLS